MLKHAYGSHMGTICPVFIMKYYLSRGWSL